MLFVCKINKFIILLKIVLFINFPRIYIYGFKTLLAKEYCYKLKVVYGYNLRCLSCKRMINLKILYFYFM